MAIARRWRDVVSNAVDPGWVPTRMGGPGTPNDLVLGHRTHTGDEPSATSSGGYRYHQHTQRPATAARDVGFQNRLISRLPAITGCSLP